MGRYFYAGGERHELQPVEDRLAIDVRAASEAGLGDVVRKVKSASRLPSGMTVIERASIDDATIERLNAAGVVQPVYRYGPSLVVLMPEVRVELEGAQHDDAVRAVAASVVDAELTDDTPERLSLRPLSGRGEDALDLANFIYEQARPASSTVRMLQIVPKPVTKR